MYILSYTCIQYFEILYFLIYKLNIKYFVPSLVKSILVLHHPLTCPYFCHSTFKLSCQCLISYTTPRTPVFQNLSDIHGVNANHIQQSERSRELDTE